MNTNPERSTSIAAICSVELPGSPLPPVRHADVGQCAVRPEAAGHQAENAHLVRHRRCQDLTNPHRDYRMLR
jgi:hypothetical protein